LAARGATRRARCIPGRRDRRRARRVRPLSRPGRCRGGRPPARAARADVCHRAGVVGSRVGERLHRNRIKIGLWVAVVEGLLALIGVIPRWFVFVLAALAVAFWALAARNYKSATSRSLGWIFAVSQAAAVLVPVVWYLARWVAIIAIA